MLTSTTSGQRFIQLIQQLGITKNAFAQSLGKTATVVQHIVDERNKPGFDLLNKVCEVYPNVSSDWLVLGRGAMLRGQNPQALFAEPEAAPATAPAAPAPALHGIDPDDIPPTTRRRYGTLLQPADIAATLALAAQGNGQHSPAGPAAAPAAMPGPAAIPVPEPVVAGPAAAPAPAAAPSPAPVPVPLTLPSTLPDPAYLAAALHTLQLQHQLALAEQRNQHLLEQQALLKQMLALVQR